MIISNKQVQSILQMNQVSGVNKKKGVTAESTPVKKSDTLTLSDRAQGLQFAKEQVLKSPEVRADKVNELKNQIQDGQYQVSATEIANKMFGRSLVDELAGR